jgi:hypothetical protein
METIFKGSLKECLKHLSENEFDVPPEQYLLKFVGASKKSVNDWLTEKTFPKGKYLSKLRFALEHMGYDLNDQYLRPEIKQYCALFAFGLIDMEFVMQDLKLANDSVLCVFRGGCGTSDENYAHMEEMYKAFTSDLEERKSKIQPPKLLSIKATEPKEQKTLEEKRPEDVIKPLFVAPRKVEYNVAIDKETIINLIVIYIKGLMPLLDFAVSENFTDEDREKIRELCGEGVVFDVSTNMNRLCGKTAFKVYGEKFLKKEGVNGGR